MACGGVADPAERRFHPGSRGTDKPPRPGGRPGGANGNARLPFVGNIIPKDRLDPVALAIQGLIPNPQGANAGQLAQNFTPTGPSAQADRLTDITSLKADQNLTDKMKISGFWS